MTLFILIAIAVVLFIVAGKSSPDKETHAYTASYGDESDHLSFWNKGFAIGNKAFTKHDSYTNLLLSGPTGSGKSSIITIPCARSLSRANTSIIFNDISYELFQHTSKYLQRRGFRIVLYNFSDSQNSECFNPLLSCKTVADIQKLSQIIVQNTVGESKADPFWENSAIMLLSLMGRYLVFYTEAKYRTLQNLQRLIEKFVTNPKVVDKLFVKTDEELLNVYKATIVMGEKTLQSVVATARTALNLWNDMEVCKTTATNSIDFSILRKEKVAIYICNPLRDLKYFAPLSALFFQSLFNEVLSTTPKKNDNSIFFVLDEFASMKFPDISVTVSNIRKYNAGLLLCVQDEVSLLSRYGQSEAHNIKTNCGIKIYLKGQPHSTCKELSSILGKYTYEDEKGLQRTRELLTADEVRLLEDALVLVHNNLPLRITPTPFYESFWLSHLRNATSLAFAKKSRIAPPLLSFS